MDRQIRVGGGILLTPLSAVDIGLAYEFIDFGKAVINNTSRNGVLAGDYRSNYMNVVAFNINVRI